jgi:hypothetical protein
MANGPRCWASVILAGCSIVAGCSSPPRYAAPQTFTVSNAAVAQVVHDAITGDRFAAQLDGSPEVNCAGRATCTVSYKVHEAIGAVFHKEHLADEQLIAPTAQMWNAFFRDSQFQQGTITVEGPVPAAAGTTQNGPYFSLACGRAAASKINWDTVDGHGLRSACDYNVQTRGLPGDPSPN